ncbi:GNAT family N-acetyltransferase [Pseudoalteromonas luteoviolacea]|uniref:GNAT family N-acetyltransferase n=1 Tax=Pseudoalteromonas luteoviolacea TaxID=43657 RepID=UPI00114E1A94|nr:GNAT family protein [Pseudoalteromonas luteoviolacea]TQF71186.1 GNAT family N-acetyltransferase [Pseudoalteromonas luteoviolacea]
MLEATILETNKVRLEPLSYSHLEALEKVGKDDVIWRWVPSKYCQSPEVLRNWFEQTAQFNAKEQLVFAIIDTATNSVTGNTRIFRLDETNLQAEIGHTFIGVEWQRSHVNTHAKYLLLRHAFEHLGLVRIEFQTHEQNHKSRSAIARLGAHFEGIHLKNRKLPDGSFRNTARFSITDEMWPEIKSRLEEWL